MDTAGRLISCVLQLKMSIFELFAVFLQMKKTANYFFVVDNFFYTIFLIIYLII